MKILNKYLDIKHLLFLIFILFFNTKCINTKFKVLKKKNNSSSYHSNRSIDLKKIFRSILYSLILPLNNSLTLQPFTYLQNENYYGLDFGSSSSIFDLYLNQTLLALNIEKNGISDTRGHILSQDNTNFNSINWQTIFDTPHDNKINSISKDQNFDFYACGYLTKLSLLDPFLPDIHKDAFIFKISKSGDFIDSKIIDVRFSNGSQIIGKNEECLNIITKNDQTLDIIIKRSDPDLNDILYYIKVDQNLDFVNHFAIEINNFNDQVSMTKLSNNHTIFGISKNDTIYYFEISSEGNYNNSFFINTKPGSHLNSLTQIEDGFGSLVSNSYGYEIIIFDEFFNIIFSKNLPTNLSSLQYHTYSDLIYDNLTQRLIFVGSYLDNLKYYPLITMFDNLGNIYHQKIFNGSTEITDFKNSHIKNIIKKNNLFWNFAKFTDDDNILPDRILTLPLDQNLNALYDCNEPISDINILFINNTLAVSYYIPNFINPSLTITSSGYQTNFSNNLIEGLLCCINLTSNVSNFTNTISISPSILPTIISSNTPSLSPTISDTFAPTIGFAPKSNPTVANSAFNNLQLPIILNNPVDAGFNTRLINGNESILITAGDNTLIQVGDHLYSIFSEQTIFYGPVQNGTGSQTLESFDISFIEVNKTDYFTTPLFEVVNSLVFIESMIILCGTAVLPIFPDLRQAKITRFNILTQSFIDTTYYTDLNNDIVCNSIIDLNDGNIAFGGGIGDNSLISIIDPNTMDQIANYIIDPDDSELFSQIVSINKIQDTIVALSNNNDPLSFFITIAGNVVTSYSIELPSNELISQEFFVSNDVNNTIYFTGRNNAVSSNYVVFEILPDATVLNAWDVINVNPGDRFTGVSTSNNTLFFSGNFANIDPSTGFFVEFDLLTNTTLVAKQINNTFFDNIQNPNFTIFTLMSNPVSVVNNIFTNAVSFFEIPNGQEQVGGQFIRFVEGRITSIELDQNRDLPIFCPDFFLDFPGIEFIPFTPIVTIVSPNINNIVLNTTLEIPQIFNNTIISQECETNSPTLSPSNSPSDSPSDSPTQNPTLSPTTGSPTISPTTSSPTQSPTTGSPTRSPTTVAPTPNPTPSPTFAEPTTGSPTPVDRSCSTAQRVLRILYIWQNDCDDEQRNDEDCNFGQKFLAWITFGAANNCINGPQLDLSLSFAISSSTCCCCCICCLFPCLWLQFKRKGRNEGRGRRRNRDRNNINRTLANQNDRDQKQSRKNEQEVEEEEVIEEVEEEPENQEDDESEINEEEN